MSDPRATRTPEHDEEEAQLREMNEALLVSSVRQHELTDLAQRAEAEAVTARLAMQALNGILRENERRFREMIDALPTAVYTTDAEGRLTHFNPACVELSGRTPELGTDAWCVSWKLFHPDGSPMPHDECPMAIALKEGRIVRGVEAIAERPDGTRICFTPYPTPLRDADGRVVGGINMLVDITEHKRAESLIRASEERFRTLVEHVEDYAIFRTDPEGHPATWNQGVERVLGFTEAEFLGQDIASLIFTPEDVRNGVPQAELEQAAVKGTARGDRWMQRNDGTRFFAMGTTTALRDEAGQLIGFTKVKRDQTAQKRLEDELRRTGTELAKDDRRKDEFLAMLAHELRNPLATAVYALRLLRAPDVDPARQAELQERIERSVGQLSRLLDDLLDVSRIKGGKALLRKAHLQLLPVLNSAIQAVTPLIEARKQALTVSAPPESLWLEADATRLEQILVNLLQNAAKYTEEGGRIELSLEREPPAAEGPGFVTIRVRDNGIGIAPEMLPLVFDLFSQADRAPDRAAGGMGIGLTLVRRLVEEHGGSVEAHSEGLGRGAEMCVRLPLLAVEHPAAAAADPGSATAAFDVPPGMRVLIVEDRDDAAESLAELLTLWGHEERRAANGPSALAMVFQFRPEVVLLDIGLPGMDGYEVARRLREDPAFDGRVIALSGYGQEADRKRSSEAGFDLHLTKPVDPDELREVLARLSAEGGA